MCRRQDYTGIRRQLLPGPIPPAAKKEGIMAEGLKLAVGLKLEEGKKLARGIYGTAA